MVWHCANCDLGTIEQAVWLVMTASAEPQKITRREMAMHRRSAAAGHMQRRTVEVQAGGFAVFQGVAQGDPQAIALINPQGQGLNGVAL